MATYFWAAQLVSGQLWLIRERVDRARPEPCAAAPPEPSPPCKLASCEACKQLGYLLFVNRGLDPGDPVEWGGGMGLRFHPLGTAAAYVPPARGLWIDANGRYGTRGWGFDSSLGWDLSLSEVVLLGPVVGVVREQGEWRKVASLSLSFSLNMEAIDGSDEP